MKWRHWIAEKILRVPVKSQVVVTLVCEEVDLQIQNTPSGQRWKVGAWGGCQEQGWEVKTLTDEDKTIGDWVSKNVYTRTHQPK